MGVEKSLAVCFTHIGKRLNHEDNLLINDLYLTSDLQKKMVGNGGYLIREVVLSKVRLFVISDGMGGHNAGEVASRICVEKLAIAQKELQRYDSIKEVVSHLQKVILDINNCVCNLSCKQDELKGMGATLVIFVICGSEYAILNIGDSRAYYFNNIELIQITKDHTEGQRMLDLGILTRKELKHFPASKNLNRYIGYSQKGYILQADEYYPFLENGVLLLCSDGITDALSDRRILDILHSETNLERIGKKLINEAITLNHADNSTVILVPIRR